MSVIFSVWSKYEACGGKNVRVMRLYMNYA